MTVNKHPKGVKQFTKWEHYHENLNQQHVNYK